MFTSSDMLATVRAAGIPASLHTLYYAIQHGRIDAPIRSITGQYLFTPTHLDQYREYCSRERVDGRRPRALDVAVAK